jgi:hypothetical protein
MTIDGFTTVDGGEKSKTSEPFIDRKRIFDSHLPMEKSLL